MHEFPFHTLFYQSINSRTLLLSFSHLIFVFGCDFNSFLSFALYQCIRRSSIQLQPFSICRQMYTKNIYTRKFIDSISRMLSATPIFHYPSNNNIPRSTHSCCIKSNIWKYDLELVRNKLFLNSVGIVLRTERVAFFSIL